MAQTCNIYCWLSFQKLRHFLTHFVLFILVKVHQRLPCSSFCSFFLSLKSWRYSIVSNIYGHKQHLSKLFSTQLPNYIPEPNKINRTGKQSCRSTRIVGRNKGYFNAIIENVENLMPSFQQQNLQQIKGINN